MSLLLLKLVFVWCMCTAVSSLAKRPPTRAIADLGTGPASQHSCFILERGLGVKCIGGNNVGQLGILHTRAVGDDGIFEMGDCLRVSALGERPQPTQVVMGSAFTCAVTARGEVRCYGSCSGGVCGTGQTAGNIGDGLGESPGALPAIVFPSPVVQLAAGELHVCALLQNQRVYCWGAGPQGQLGNGLRTAILSRPDLAHPIDFGQNRSVVQISAGYSHTCAVLESRTNPGETDLVCFGSCVFGKCGTGKATDTVEMGESLPEVGLGTDSQGKRRWALQVSAGAAHTCVLLNTNEAACFGLGRLLGTGGKTNNIGDDPFEMDNLQVVNLNNRKVESVSVGQQHSCAVLSGKHQAVCWGEGQGGVLGYDSQEQVLIPGTKVVKLPKGFKVRQVRAYASHTCVLSAAGGVFCWGNNKFGRIGALALGGATSATCLGCSRGQMARLKRLVFGCVSLTKNGSCPFLPETSNKCEICGKGWSKDLCNTYSIKCRWLGKVARCIKK